MADQMQKADRKGSHLRVVLGATCYADAESTLILASELARQLRAELHGLLVRDEAIFSAAGHLKAYAVSYSGQPGAAVTADAMLRAFEADARRFEHQLLTIGRRAAIGTGFSASEGRLAEALQRSAERGDLAIFGFRREVRDSGSVVLILGAGRQPPAFAEPLAAGLGKRLVVLSEAGSGADSARPAAESRQFLGPDELLRQLDALSPAAVIVAADSAALPAPTRLLDAARCPVVFTGG